MPNTTEQLAKECGADSMLACYIFTSSELEAFRLASIRDYFENAEPEAWMSPSRERIEFARKYDVYGSHTIQLYAAQKE